MSPARSVARGAARRDELLLVLLSSCALASCSNASAPPPAVAPAAEHADEAGPLARYRSRRLGLSLSLPHGREWRIDDHSQPELVATHAATRSRVVVSVFTAGELVGRAQCEDLARERRLVPAGDLRPLEDVVSITQGTFDTRVVVSVSPDEATGALAGHVMAFGGFLRRCYVFVYSTEVASAADEGDPCRSASPWRARARLRRPRGRCMFDSVGRDPVEGPSARQPPR